MIRTDLYDYLDLACNCLVINLVTNKVEGMFIKNAARAANYLIFCFAILFLPSCSTNPATGQQQFTALMPPQKEKQIGAQEHVKVVKQFGIYQDKDIQLYVSEVGQRLAKNTERPDVSYKFFLLDTPMVNAFALPGGYVYITRGILALANSESEMASVLAHEIGHITARHSAERYSRGVVTNLGAAILSSAIGSSTVSDVLGIGTDIYMKSYSREQENQADSLGIRYLSRAGYSPQAMSSFLHSLQRDTEFNQRLSGKNNPAQKVDFFSTHPATAERIGKTAAQAQRYPANGVVNREGYLKRISGMVYGDNSAQGFVRGNSFYHPDMGFKFDVPKGFKIVNRPEQVIGIAKDGTLIVFDMQTNGQGISPMEYLRGVMLEGRKVDDAENITINGLPAATASFRGKVNGRPMTIRLVAIHWRQDQIVRFQIAMPLNITSDKVKALRASTYSFRPMTKREIMNIKPYKLIVITAKPGDGVASLSKRMPFEDFRQERFRLLNSLGENEDVRAGRLYKLVVK